MRLGDTLKLCQSRQAMRNLTYGFEHLEHRYRALGGNDATVIPIERRLNLNDFIADRFGSTYATHPKLPSLMEMNGGIHRHVLTSAEEVQAFQNNEFIRMHGSTLAKVGFFHSAVRKMASGKLRTASRGYGIALNRLFESRLANRRAHCYHLGCRDRFMANPFLVVSKFFKLSVSRPGSPSDASAFSLLCDIHWLDALSKCCR